MAILLMPILLYSIYSSFFINKVYTFIMFPMHTIVFVKMTTLKKQQLAGPTSTSVASILSQAKGKQASLTVHDDRSLLAVQGPAGDFVRNPDLTVWFDLAPEVAAERLAQARTPDRFEAQPVTFFRRVAAGYAQRLAADPGRFARIEANLPRDAVWRAVRQAVQARGWLA